MTLVLPKSHLDLRQEHVHDSLRLSNGDLHEREWIDICRGIVTRMRARIPIGNPWVRLFHENIDAIARRVWNAQPAPHQFQKEGTEGELLHHTPPEMTKQLWISQARNAFIFMLQDIMMQITVKKRQSEVTPDYLKLQEQIEDVVKGMNPGEG